jgi:hypothetical protein
MLKQKTLNLGLIACLFLLPGRFSEPANRSAGSGPAEWSAESDQPGAAFGGSVAGVGDVNGDGFADLLTGAPFFDQSQLDEGRVDAFYGSALGPSSLASWTVAGGQAGARLGWSVAGAGDVNGDGYTDILVAAPEYSNGQLEEGKAWLYAGSATGLSTQASWSAEGDQTNAAFGFSLSGAGDVNGDGYADVIAGAKNASHGQAGEGRAFVFRLPAGLNTIRPGAARAASRVRPTALLLPGPGT